MYCLATLLRHRPPRKTGGLLPSFPSDTLTKVYRDAMRGDAEATPRPSTSLLKDYEPWSNKVEVTSHVGGIGTMNPAAFKRLQPEVDEHHDGYDHGHGAADGREHSHRSGARHRPISRHRRQSISISAATAESLNTEVITSVQTLHARKLLGTEKAGEASSGRQASWRPRHSGVQREMIYLYRSLLRETNRMDDIDTRVNLRRYIRAEFNKYVDVPRKHIVKIEWCINYGKRKLEELKGMSSRTKFSMR